MIKKALIIAAGNGSRLQSDQVGLPKPLRKVSGLPLIHRIILTAKQAGISEFVIVVGYQKEKIIQSIQSKDLGVKVTFVENPEWKKSNGVSVICAQSHLKEDFVLLMSDHVFEADTLKKFCQQGLGNNKVSLAVDYKLNSIYDMDDATKVWVENGQVQTIGKSLTRYNAVDTGMFLASPELFEALEASKKDGDCSLSDGIQRLASRGQMGTFDIQDAFWQDVDTLECLKHCEQSLLNSCRKPTDGFISRHVNRNISLFCTRFLIKTGLTANQMTAVTSVIGILSGVFAAKGDYWNVLLGGFLFNLASILDGCDGEIARLRMTQSKLGQWLDTASDNSSLLSFLIGVIIGVGRQGNPLISVTAPLTIFGLVMTLSVMFIYLIRYTNSGSLVAVEKDFKQVSGGNLIKKILIPLRFAVRRDFFATLFFVLTVFGRLDIILWLLLIGTNVLWMVVLKTLLVARQEAIAADAPVKAPHS